MLEDYLRPADAAQNILWKPTDLLVVLAVGPLRWLPFNHARRRRPPN
ncbi:MAG: hypothetical protein QMB94_08565 [Phycisphaerales bacterium]